MAYNGVNNARITHPLPATSEVGNAIGEQDNMVTSLIIGDAKRHSTPVSRPTFWLIHQLPFISSSDVAVYPCTFVRPITRPFMTPISPELIPTQATRMLFTKLFYRPRI